MTPYEVFFFSSGGVEEHWTREGPEHDAGQRVHRLPARRAAVARDRGRAAVVFLPAGIRSTRSARSALPVALALGKIGLAVALLGFFAATFGAACETGLSVGYSIAQYFGWQWGKYVAPRRGRPVPRRRPAVDACSRSPCC